MASIKVRIDGCKLGRNESNVFCFVCRYTKIISFNIRRIEPITQPSKTREDVERIIKKDLETFATGKQVIHTKRLKKPEYSMQLDNIGDPPLVLKCVTLKKDLEANSIRYLLKSTHFQLWIFFLLSKLILIFFAVQYFIKVIFCSSSSKESGVC